MIVYGDPSYPVSMNSQLARLTAQLQTVRQNSSPSLDDLRTLLIGAGQMEQAVEDALTQSADSSPIKHCQSITDSAATAFLARWLDSQNDAPLLRPDLSGALATMARGLENTAPLDLHLTVKVPEGFAFYTLFPEAYCAAALRWLAAHSNAAPRHAVVIGIRSIGTALSALVSATLNAGGWQAHRFTVRPTGHPFSRQVEIDAHEIKPAEWSLIVDEGPGLSGSSMASVAEAVQLAGIARARISFFPGHGGEPGEKASPEVRAWWKAAPRFVTPLQDLRWNGRSLAESLAELTPALCGTNQPVESIEDLSGGVWRSVVYRDSNAWPAVAAPFERTKIRVTLRGGDAVLWKFVGFASASNGEGSAAESMQQELLARAAAGWSIAPLGAAFGFVATRWMDGEALTLRDATPALLSHIGRYIAAISGAPLSDSEQKTALARLQEMLFFNTREALGETAAMRAQELGVAAMNAQKTLPRTYGDGHLAPHEWLRTRSGAILKTDALGHDNDHTLIGRQSFAWDVAGAIIEWKLSDTATASLLAALQDAGNEIIPPDVLRFHLLAYAAFRLGQCSLCAAIAGHDAPEQFRLERAGDLYREALARHLR